MTLKERLKKYLAKRREPVGHDELLQKAKLAQVKYKEIKDILYNIHDDDDMVDVASWYGHPFDTFKPTGKKQRWYQYVPLTPKQKQQMLDDRRWFESL